MIRKLGREQQLTFDFEGQGGFDPADLVLESASVDAAIVGRQLGQRRALGSVETERAANGEDGVAAFRLVRHQFVRAGTASGQDFHSVFKPSDGRFGFTLGGARHVEIGILGLLLQDGRQLADESGRLEHAQVDEAGTSGAQFVARLAVVNAFAVLAGDRNRQFRSGSQNGGLCAGLPPAVLRNWPAGRICSASQSDGSFVDGNRLFRRDFGRSGLVFDQQLEGGVAGSLRNSNHVGGPAKVAPVIGGGHTVESEDGSVGSELSVAFLEPLDGCGRRFGRDVARNDDAGANLHFLALRLAANRHDGRMEHVQLQFGLADLSQSVVGRADVNAIFVQADGPQSVIEAGGDVAASPGPAHVVNGRFGVHLALDLDRSSLLDAQRAGADADSRCVCANKKKVNSSPNDDVMGVRNQVNIVMRI